MGLSIQAAHAEEAQATKTETPLPTVTVRGSGPTETATGPVSGYVAKRGSSATKSDTPLNETPRSISVVTRDQMTDQAVQTAEQALRYTAGVLTEVTGYDLRYQSMIVRGFAPTTYRDGLRVFSGAGSFSDWATDPQGLERIEVLKGPASVMYGQGSPGGLVNQVSKRPTTDKVNEVGFSVGNHDRYQATIDVGGQFDSNGTVLFRLNGLARDSKTQTDYSKDNRLYLAPSLTWRPNAQTSLTLLADVTEDRMTPKSWWPDKSLLASDSHGEIPVSAFAGVPGFDHYNRDMASIAYLLEHKVGERLALRQNVRYAKFKLDYQHVFSDDWVDSSDRSNPLITRYPLFSRTDGRAWTVDNQANIKLDTGPLQHDVVVGLDLLKFSGSADEGYGDALADFNPFQPVYGDAIAEPPLTHSTNRLWQVGVYAQDQMKIGQLIMNLGLRHDRAVNKYADSDDYSSTAEDSKSTYNLGVLYKLRGGISPYASYATSFDPAMFGTTFGDGMLKPETGRQVELGVKFQPEGSNSFITASIFDLRKQNVATADPDPLHVGSVVQTGEVRSRGLELEGTASLSRQLSLIASYTFLDSEVIRDNDLDILGLAPAQTARNTAKAWLNYKLSGALSPWHVGAGVRYVGKVVASVSNSDPSRNYSNPSYTLVDAVVGYQSGPVTLTLNAANLFDKAYVSNRGMFYGQGRTLQAAVAYRW